MNPIRIFIRSVQKEFAAERTALRDFLRGDALLRRFFEPFLFEDVPAADRRADAVYLDEVERCDIYLGLFGDDYGSEDIHGVSPTQREFESASERHKLRLVFGMGTGTRDMIRLCGEAGLREPEYALRDGFVQILWRPSQHAIPQAEAQEAQAEAQEAQATLTPTELILLTACTGGPALGRALLSAAGYRERTGNFKRSLERLLAEGLLAMTLPDKPTSPNQKYRLTDKGQAWLEARRK